MTILLAQKSPSGIWKASVEAAPPAGATIIAFDPAKAEISSTDIIAEAVSGVRDPVWQFELAANASLSDKAALLAGQDLARAALESDSSVTAFALKLSGNSSGETALRSLKAALGDRRFLPRIANALLQITASKLAWLSALWLLLRYGGSSASELGNVESQTIFALHAEDTTRTRHLRAALVQDLQANPRPATILLLGRPSSSIIDAQRALDPKDELGQVRALRPTNVGAFLRALPASIALLARGISATGSTTFPIRMRERTAMAYRVIQGCAQARWWQSAAKHAPSAVLFGHTGTADTSLLEMAMQSGGVRTVHVVHGTNIGWPFAGLSDVAIFQTGAGAALGASLPAYRQSAHLPATCPQLRGGLGAGDGRWAVLTSYTHLSNPAYHQSGANADIAVIEMAALAAAKLGQAPEQILWRPHPHIELVAPLERDRLLAAVAAAGFTRWPAALPYEALGAFSAAITTPSTVLTDALRRGQPAIVVSLEPIQNDLIYNRHPLLTQDLEGVLSALQNIANPTDANALLQAAWNAIEPGAPLSINAVLAAVEPT